MKVNLNIEEDDQFRTYVKELIGGQVRAQLREELRGIVTAEIAKLRILQPNSPTLGELVEKEVKAKTAGYTAQNNISAVIVKEVQKLIPSIKDEIIKNVMKGLTIS